VPSAAKPEIVPSLIVMNSRGASLQGQTLTLMGISPNSTSGGGTNAARLWPASYRTDDCSA
jgi:hypothetical protein